MEIPAELEHGNQQAVVRRFAERRRLVDIMKKSRNRHVSLMDHLLSFERFQLTLVDDTDHLTGRLAMCQTSCTEI
jgi:hypothetical protein